MRNILLLIRKWFLKYKFQIWLALGLRIGYSVWLAIVWIVIDKYIPLTDWVLWETYYNLSRSSTLFGRAFIDVWLRWDAVHYMNIAEFGYKGVGVGDTVFFPLYPYLVGGISKLTTFNVTLVGILTSSIATMVAFIFFYELVIDLFNDDNLAKWSVLSLAFYPTSFFLHAPYTDALFLSLSIGSILIMVRKKPILAGLFAFGAGLARAQGILLLIPMIVFYVQNHIKDKRFLKWRELTGVFIAPLGFLGYTIWRMQSGMENFIDTYQAYSNAGFRFPWENIFLEIKILFEKPSLLLVSELFSVLFFLIMLIWMSTQKKFQKQLAILIYSFSTWILITSKTTFWASPLQSANRYVLHIFFVFVGLAAIMQRFPNRIRKLILLISLLFNIFMLVSYGLWFFIG